MNSPKLRKLGFAKYRPLKFAKLSCLENYNKVHVVNGPKSEINNSSFQAATHALWKHLSPVYFLYNNIFRPDCNMFKYM